MDLEEIERSLSVVETKRQCNKTLSLINDELFWIM